MDRVSLLGMKLSCKLKLAKLRRVPPSKKTEDIKRMIEHLKRVQSELKDACRTMTVTLE